MAGAGQPSGWQVLAGDKLAGDGGPNAKPAFLVVIGRSQKRKEDLLGIPSRPEAGTIGVVRRDSGATITNATSDSKLVLVTPIRVEM